MVYNKYYSIAISCIITISVFIILVVLLFSANREIEVSAIINPEEKYLKDDQPILYADEKYYNLKVPTLTVNSNDIITFNAIINPDYNTIIFPNIIKKRAQWFVFYRSHDSRWFKIRQGQNKCFTKSITFNKNPGQYIILYALPPTSISMKKIDNKSTSYICEFLSNNINRSLKAVQLIIKTGDEEVPEFPINKYNDYHILNLQPSINLPPPQIITDSEINKIQIKKTLTAEIPDKTTKKEGEKENKVDTENIVKNSDNNKETEKKHEIVKIPPQEDYKSQIPLKITWRDGNLPDMVLKYNPGDFKQITLKDWEEIIKKYNMPFFAQEDIEFRSDNKNLLIIFNSTKREETYEAAIKNYGSFYLPLTIFNEEIYSFYREKLNDPIFWYKSHNNRGVFLNDYLLLCLEKIMENNKIQVSDLNTIKTVEVTIIIISGDAGKELIAESGEITWKK